MQSFLIASVSQGNFVVDNKTIVGRAGFCTEVRVVDYFHLAVWFSPIPYEMVQWGDLNPT